MVLGRVVVYIKYATSHWSFHSAHQVLWELCHTQSLNSSGI